MHKVKARNIKRNEGGKFNGDTGLMENPCKGVIKFSEKEPLTAVAHYDGMDDCWIMTNEEKEALTSGKNYLIPENIIQGLKTVATMTLDLVKSAEEGQG